MTSRAPFILAIVVLLLGAYIFLFERDRPRQAEVERREGFLVPSLVHDRVSQIRIDSGPTQVVLFREGEGFDETWTLDTPDGPPADIEKVENYLREWSFAMPTRTLENPTTEDVEAFGLNEPGASVQFEMGQGKVTVSLGSGEPVDGGGYVRIDGKDHARVVPGGVVELFDYGADRFRIENDAGAPDLDALLDGGAVAPIDASTQQDAATAPAPP